MCLCIAVQMANYPRRCPFSTAWDGGPHDYLASSFRAFRRHLIVHHQCDVADRRHGRDEIIVALSAEEAHARRVLLGCRQGGRSEQRRARRDALSSSQGSAAPYAPPPWSRPPPLPRFQPEPAVFQSQWVPSPSGAADAGLPDDEVEFDSVSTGWLSAQLPELADVRSCGPCSRMSTPPPVMHGVGVQAAPRMESVGVAASVVGVDAAVDAPPPTPPTVVYDAGVSASPDTVDVATDAAPLPGPRYAPPPVPVRELAEALVAAMASRPSDPVGQLAQHLARIFNIESPAQRRSLLGLVEFSAAVLHGMAGSLHSRTTALREVLQGDDPALVRLVVDEVAVWAQRLALHQEPICHWIEED